MEFGVNENVDFGYSTKKNIGTIADISKVFIAQPELRRFIPDDVEIESLDRIFLLSVLFYHAPEQYQRLKNELNAFNESKKESKYLDLHIVLSRQLKDEIQAFGKAPV